jgi:hypothetical protein
MSDLINTIHNIESNEIIERPLNAAEIKIHEAGAKIAADELDLKQSQEAAKAALLNKLGITADEAKLLLS